jgi:hypothetical protein
MSPFVLSPDDTLLPMTFLLVWGLIGWLAIIVSSIGILRVGAGLGISIVWRILLCVIQIVPLIDPITLLILNSRATRRLTDKGFKVGLLGSPKK